MHEGTHVGFAAGTGILAYIDLIAHLILLIIDQNNPGINLFS